MTPTPTCHLVVSPHLDDGVLSRGALISAWRRLGHRVVILTVFSGGPATELSAAALADQARYQEDPLTLRLAEDDAAVRILDCETLRLDLPEVLFRHRRDGNPRLQSLDDIYDPLIADDNDVIASVRAAIGEVVEQISPDWIHVPAGLGHHIDHAVVRSACEQLETRRDGGELALYEDVPYALGLDKPSAEREVPNGAVEAHTPWALDDADVDRWIEATEAYATQIGIMFEESDWRDAFRQWAQTGGAARVWTFE